MKRLIVNADDLGYSEGVDAGIARAHRDGIVTAATFMVNQVRSENAALLVRGLPRLDVGVHLVITSGRPLSARDRVPSLVDERGMFHRPGDVLRGGAVRTDEVLAEFRAQLARARELLGRVPSHIDTHHWVEQEPAVLEAFAEVARETGAVARAIDVRIRERLRSAGVRTTDAYSREFQHSGRIDVPALLAILDGLTDGVTELGCHPGERDVELESRSSYARERPVELATLTDPAVRSRIAEAGIDLVTFGAV